MPTDKPLQKENVLEENRNNRKDAFIRNGFSYSSVLLNKLGSSSSESGKESGPGQEPLVEVHSETSAFFDLHGRAVVGRVKDIDILINLKELFQSSKVPEFKFHYLGGLNILVVFDDVIDASDFILNIQLWKDWFESLDVWSGQILAYERIAWLKFHGVPLHLAENKVFNDVAAQFGKVIKGSQLSSSDWDMSYSCVGVLVDTGARISGSTTIVWRNKKFKVWVLEERDNWIPDCLFEDKLTENINNQESGQEGEEEHAGEEENEDSEYSSDENGGSSDESDGDPVEPVGGQEVLLPEFSPVGGIEQSVNTNDGGVLNDPVLGNVNDIESFQDPLLESVIGKSGGT
ncbi:hypothetical protein Hdeb2414_s0022g00617861 [Helianthus debilis subsp. tardiflorus]